MFTTDRDAKIKPSVIKVQHVARGTGSDLWLERHVSGRVKFLINCIIHTHNCPRLPRWAGTRRNIHPLTPILFLRHPISTSSIYYDPQHPHCSVHVLDSPFLQPLSKLSLVFRLVLNPLLHTFLHPIIILLLQHMPIPSQPVLLRKDMYHGTISV